MNLAVKSFAKIQCDPVAAVLHYFWVHWKSLVIILVPLIFLPLALVDGKEAKCGFVICLMALYWMTEALPLPVTSLIPVVLFPLFGILSTDEVCLLYFKETNVMFLGGVIIAIAIEHCNLHKRIALKVLLMMGTSPQRLILGFMVTTMFLSMWISNSAATAMMAPIVTAVLDELKCYEEGENNRRRPTLTESAGVITSMHDSGNFDGETRRKSVTRIDISEINRPSKDQICYFLGIAYAANIGGTGTITGTSTNLVFKGIFESIFKDAEGINFATWMEFNVPLMLLNTLLAWLWLQFLYMGLFRRKKNDMKTSKEQEKQVRDLILSSYEKLGPITFHEGSVLFLFVLDVFLWFFRKPEFISGWWALFPEKVVKDATAAIAIVILLFILPANLDFLKFDPEAERNTVVIQSFLFALCVSQIPFWSALMRLGGISRRSLEWFRWKDKKSQKESPALLNWKVLHEKIPFGIILLLGGGFAISKGCEVSGLSDYLGYQLEAVKQLPLMLTLSITAFSTTFATEVSSNTAIANILLPVLAKMCRVIRIHPLYLMMPTTISCSYAFMLPVATPPNAIVMAASNMKSSEMMKAGLGMNIICVASLIVCFIYIGVPMYNLESFPSWAEINAEVVL